MMLCRRICLFALFPLSLLAQTYTTTDSALETGSPLAETSHAPGTNGAVGLVHSKSNSSTDLWLIDTNPWGVTRGSGTLSISYPSSGSIVTTVNLHGLPGGGVDGSPFVLLGCDQWAGCYTKQPPQFPKQLSAMSSLTVDYSYALSGSINGSRDIDMIWDEWVCKTSHPSGIADCLEVEVLPYYSFYDGHPTTFIRTVDLPVTLDGKSETWYLDEYSWGDGSQNITYIPQTLPGLSGAEIRFNMLTLLDQAVKDYGSSSFSWLMGMEAGTEFGANATQSYTLKISKLEIQQTLR